MGARTIFTQEEDDVLRRLYAQIGASGCARRIDKTIPQIWNRAYILGAGKAGKRREAPDPAQRGIAPVERYDHRALSAALGIPAQPPEIQCPSWVTVHRLQAGA